MKVSVKNIFILCCVVLVPLACVHNDDDDDDAKLNYNGNRNAAVLSSSNSDQVFNDFMGGLGSANSASSNSDIDDNTPDTLSKVAQKIQRFKVTARNEHASNSTTEEIAGSCGGKETTSYAFDPDTNAMDMTSISIDYCEEGEIINGTMKISATFSDDFESFTMTATFENISFQSVSEEDKMTMNGTMVGTMTTNDAEEITDFTMNATLVNEIKNITYLLENFKFYAEETSTSFGNIEIKETYTGRVYQSELGYVDITTPTPFIFDYNEFSIEDDFPESGAMLLKGEGGSTMTLTALNSTKYQLDVDETGDGTIDFTETDNWINLDDDFIFFK